MPLQCFWRDSVTLISTFNYIATYLLTYLLTYLVCAFVTYVRPLLEYNAVVWSAIDIATEAFY